MGDNDANPGLRPLTLSSLRASGFRNLSPCSLAFGERFNVFFGDNGAGKSSLLEAIAYLACLRSFRGAKRDDIIAQGSQAAVLDAQLTAAPFPRRFQVALDRQSGRRVRVDGKRPSSLGSYFGSFPAVVFHPGDVELISGPPEPRRAVLDRILEQIDPTYAKRLADYTKALRSRNRLLKEPRIDRRSVVAYDAMLAPLGAQIGQARARVAGALKPLVESHFAEVTEQALELTFDYAFRHEPEQATLERALEESFVRDRARGFTGVGPHTDDLRVSAQVALAKHHASQGQHRAIVLSLKVAELSVLGARTGQIPPLLLDDLSSELDRRRNRRFFSLLSRLGGQVFLSTTHRELILLDHARKDFELDGGVVKAV